MTRACSLRFRCRAVSRILSIADGWLDVIICDAEIGGNDRFENSVGERINGANLQNARIRFVDEIDFGPGRVFTGIPSGFIKIESHFVPGRSTLRRRGVN